MLRNGLRALRCLDGSLGDFVYAVALQRGDLDDPAADLAAQFLYVDGIAVLADQVHHVQGDDHGNAQFDELGRQVQVALQVRSVHDVQDNVGAFFDQVIPRDDFLQRVRGKRIDARKVCDDHVLVILDAAFLLFDRDTGPVPDELVGAGQSVKQRCFTAVRVASQGNADLVSHFFCDLPS